MTTKESVIEIIKALGGTLEHESDSSRSLSEIGLDSLKTMDLILSIEEKFGLSIPDEKLNSDYLKSPNTIIALLSEMQGDIGGATK